MPLIFPACQVETRQPTSKKRDQNSWRSLIDEFYQRSDRWNLPTVSGAFLNNVKRWFWLMQFLTTKTELSKITKWDKKETTTLSFKTFYTTC